MSAFEGLKAFDCRIEDGLVRLVWNRPSEQNTFNADFCSELCLIANVLSERSDVRAVLMTSNGKLFSAGGDLRVLSADRAALPGMVKTMTATLHVALARLMALDAPVICAVHAPVYGGATSVVACADLVLAGASAQFGSAFAGIGFCCDSGSTIGLVQRMGVARARRFILLAETLSAADAAAAGLVDSVFEDSALSERAEALAQRLAAGPTKAFGEIKRLFLHATQQTVPGQLEDEAVALARITHSDDAWEGITAFVGRRRPSFRGA